MTEPTSHPQTSPHAELGFDLPAPARVSGSKALLVGGVGVGILAGVFLIAYLPRHAAQQELEKSAAATTSAIPTRAVVPVKLVDTERMLRLPASIQPLEEAVIYARANGYVSRWLVDLGAKVKEGELLAEIDTPELDQELSQARATLAQAVASKTQAEANRNLAKSNYDRAGKLVEAGVVSRQELEQNEAAAAVGDANVNVASAAIAAQQANIRRLSDLRDYSKVTAPFAGTITARNVDRGSLVTAGTGTPMFTLAATDTVRVYVQLPQDVAPTVQVGADATVTVREYAGRNFEGKVARTAGALDPATRTLNTEILIDNREGKLLSGMFAEVSVTLASPRKVYEIPATALLSDARGLRVAVVQPDDTLRLQPITVERDLGATLHVATGLSGGERIVQIADAELADGQKIKPVAAKAPPAAPGAAGAPSASASAASGAPPAATASSKAAP